MIVSKYINIKGKNYLEASDYDKLLYKLKHSNERISELENELNESKCENTENYIEYNQMTKRTYGILFQKYKGKSKNDVILNFSTFLNKLEKNGIKVYDTEEGFDIETDDNLRGNSDDLPTDPKEAAKMLINATYEYELSALEKALYKCGDIRTTERYSINDLEQIAEHLFVYCKHNREDDE